MKATIGRVGENGTRECLLNADEEPTVRDLIEQAAFDVDEDKEGATLESTGETVRFSDNVIDGEVYVIAPGVDSN